MKTFPKLASGALVMALILSLSVHQLADAFSTTYFYDHDDSTGGGNTILVAGHTTYVPDARAHVRAYFSKPQGEVGIQGVNYCPSGTWDNGPRVTGNVTRYNLGSVTKYGVYQSGNCDNSSITVNFTNMPNETIGGKPYYYVDIVATNQSSPSLNLQNGFRIFQPIKTSNNSRLFIAQVGAKSGNDVTIQQASNDGGNRNYNFRFGSDCSVTSDLDKAVSFYDLDNRGDRSGAQNSKNISLYITEIDKNNVSRRVQLTYVTVNDSDRRSYINGTSWIPSGGSGVRLNVHFMAKPSARYVATLTDVYSNNTIQFSTPFNGIYYEVPCPSNPPPGDDPHTPPPPSNDWAVSGKTTGPTGNVSVGTTLGWWHQLDKISGTATPTINFAVQQWKSGEPTYHDLLAPLSGTWRLPSAPTSPSGNGFWHTGTNYLTTDADIGKQICQRITWRGTSNLNSGASSTRPVCATVVANPAVHVFGNDVRVGSDFTNTSNNNGSASIYGKAYTGGAGASFGEYGLFAPGSISNFASQGGGSVSNPGTSNSGLTFANTSAALGRYATDRTNLGAIPNVAGSFPASVVVDHGSKDVTLSTSETTSGVRVIKTRGTITINGDLTYRNTDGGVAGLPQLILIANNINITSNVRNVNAWLVASNGGNGVVDTCSDMATRGLRVTNCNTPLTINGPVMAKTLRLKRTYYSSADRATAAESIKMRGDAYVVSERMAQQSGNWQTVYTTDLPPRY